MWFNKLNIYSSLIVVEVVTNECPSYKGRLVYFLYKNSLITAFSVYLLDRITQ